MGKGLEGPWEEQLRALEETEGRSHCGLQHPHEGQQRGRCRSLQL